MNAPGDLLEPNTVVAHRYRVARYLGDRGFGEVYQAEDTAIEADVVIMRLDKEFNHPRVRESFFETRSTAQVEDPRVVDLIDYGEDLDGRLFLVMPWIDDAVALDELIARHGALPWGRSKVIIEQIAEALEAAHNKGILHGGLALNRVLLDRHDGVHIVDFGLAPALHRPGGRVVTNVSPLPRNRAYLAPEQVRGEPVDARSDIYALGVMLWELVSGEPPFVGDPIAVANAHLERALPELSRRGAPAELEALLHVALAKDKSERIASAEEFSSLLAVMPGAIQAGARPSLGANKSRAQPRPKPAAPPPRKKPPIRQLPRTDKPRFAVAPPPSATPAAPPATTARPAAAPPPPRSQPPPPATSAPPPAPEPAVGSPAPAAAPEPAVESAIPTPIDVPELQGSTPTTRPASAPPAPARRKRRLGKLEIAILAFLAFDILVFAGYKLFGGEPATDAIAEADEPEPETPTGPAAPTEAADEAKTPEEPDSEPDSAPDPDPDPTTDPKKPQLSVHEAIAPHLPEEPSGPGPVRPVDNSLSDKDFREALVDARDDILEHCLDSRMRRTLKIQLKVSPEGKVTYNRVMGDQADTELGRCIVKRVYRIDFPATSEGGTGVYTLRLR